MKRLVTACLCLLALTVHARGAAGGDIYYEGWNAGSSAGWESTNGETSVSVGISGGNPGGCLKISGGPSSANLFGARTMTPQATGDYLAMGAGVIQLDIQYVAGDLVHAWVRIRPMEENSPGWSYRLPSPYEIGPRWKSVAAELDPTWETWEANMAGWTRESGAPTLADMMTQVHAVEVRLLSRGPVEAHIDNFRVGPPPACFDDLPTPELVFDYKLIAGAFQIRWEFTITNWSEYSPELFVREPRLSACRSTQNAPRTWIHFFRSNGAYVATYCGVRQPSELRDIWFAAGITERPDIYVVLDDRRCGKKYKSNVVSTKISNAPPLANAGGDIAVDCAGATTAVMLDGSQSADPEGAELSFAWWAPGVTFDDPASPTPVGEFPAGTTMVVLFVSDLARESSDTMYVDIHDGSPPMGTIALSRQMLWPPNGKFHTIDVSLDATDACDPDVSYVLSDIYCEENGKRLRDDDVVRGADLGTPDVEFELRAQRSGNSASRQYTILYELEDGAGNSTQLGAYVTVPHDQSGRATSGTDREAPPETTELYQNYPNPFNPETVISYYIPSPGAPVELGIYDPMGRLVRKLVDGYEDSGYKQAGWDARDSEGRPVSSGVYFYRLRTSGYEKTMKMILLR